MATSSAHPSHQLITIGPEDDDCPTCRAMRANGAFEGEALRDPDTGELLGFAQPLDDAAKAELLKDAAWQTVPKSDAPPAAEGKRSPPKGFNARRMAPLKKRRRAKGGRGHRRRRWRR